jgi:pilus assembly protein Flp/PilA
MRLPRVAAELPLNLRSSPEGTISDARGEYQMKSLTRLYVWSQIVLGDSGQDLIEYALVVALIAFAATAGMDSVAIKINTAFTNIGTKLTTYTS